MSSPNRRRIAAGCPQAGGFSLIELLVATAVIAVVLAAAYGWVWSVGSLARTSDDRAQACTIAGALARSVAADIGGGVAVKAPAAGRDPGGSLEVVHDGVDEAPEEVEIVWEAARGVVWRNAPGTYIADHVTVFGVSFVLGDGHCVEGPAMRAGDWQRVRAVRVTLDIGVGSTHVRRQLCVGVGSL